jgi:hypothetical protein
MIFSLIRMLLPTGKGRKEWNNVRLTDGAFPQSSIALIRMKSKSGGILTGWVNKGYVNYKYKRFCPTNCLVKVDLTDPRLQNDPEVDMGTVEEYFKERLSSAGVIHLVCRLCTEYGMDMEFYIEDVWAVVAAFKKMEMNPKYPLTFKYEFNDDPDWHAISGLFNL